MISGIITEEKPNNRIRVTTLHLFGDSDFGMVSAEMREYEHWFGYESSAQVNPARHSKLVAWRGPQTEQRMPNTSGA